MEEERFHGPMEVEDSEEAVHQQAAMEDELAEAYRLDAMNRTVGRLRQRIAEGQAVPATDPEPATDVPTAAERARGLYYARRDQLLMNGDI